MEIIRDNLQICHDCAIAIANDDWSGMDDKTEEMVSTGIAQLTKNGLYLVVGDEDTEFSHHYCECCGQGAGARISAALLRTEGPRCVPSVISEKNKETSQS